MTVQTRPVAAPPHIPQDVSNLGLGFLPDSHSPRVGVREGGTPNSLCLPTFNATVEQEEANNSLTPKRVTELTCRLLGKPLNGSVMKQTLAKHTDWVPSVSFSPNGKTIASASRDSTVRIWNPTTGNLRQTLTGHENWVFSISYSPNGKTIASACLNSIRIWDVTKGNIRQKLTRHIDWVDFVSFSPNGKTIASACVNSIRILDPDTGELLQTLTGHTNKVSSLSFSPEGNTIASASLDDTVRIWDSARGNLLMTLGGHTDGVLSVSFSPDGRKIASGSLDKTIRIWNSATGRLLQTLTGHTDWVLSVSFSPNGKTIASGSRDHTVRIWDLFYDLTQFPTKEQKNVIQTRRELLLKTGRTDSHKEHYPEEILAERKKQMVTTLKTVALLGLIIGGLKIIQLRRNK